MEMNKMKSLELKQKTLDVELFAPDAEYTVKQGDTLNGCKILLDGDGWYLKTPGGQRVKSPCYITADGKAYDKEKIDSEYQEKTAQVEPK